MDRRSAHKKDNADKRVDIINLPSSLLGRIAYAAVTARSVHNSFVNCSNGLQIGSGLRPRA